jgi:multiple sugar transport system permease protein
MEFQFAKNSEPQEKTRLSHYLYVLPALFFLAITSIFPVIYSFFMSFFNWNWGLKMDFVGFANYRMYLADPNFWKVLLQTVYFTIGAVVLEVTLGFILAIIVNRLSAGMEFIRTILMVPLMFSGMIVALMSKVLLDPTLGIVNFILEQVGLPTSIWFGGKASAMPSIILVDTWWRTAFVFIILSAGLRSLPVEPFEAADVDGASAFQKFRYLTIPMLRPILTTVIALRVIDCLKVFEIIFGTTGGGPGQATESIQTFAYRTAFDFMQMSRAMTIMVIFASIFLILLMVYAFLSKREALRTA